MEKEESSVIPRKFMDDTFDIMSDISLTLENITPDNQRINLLKLFIISCILTRTFNFI